MTTPQKARELVERLRNAVGGELCKAALEAADMIEALLATPQDQAGDGWRDIASAPRDGTVVQVLGITDDERDDAEDDEREPRPMPYPCYVSVQPALFWIVGAGLRNVHEDDCVGWRPLPAAPARTALGMGGEA